MVEAALGRKTLRDGGVEGPTQAVDHLSRAIAAGFRGAAAFEDLAAALSALGRTGEAIGQLKRGIELSPYSSRLYKFLVVQYINAKEYNPARQTMRRYLELFPEDNFVRGLLKNVGG